MFLILWKTHKTAQPSHIWLKQCRKLLKWPSFKKIWDIETNLDKLIGLTILKVYIKKILNLLAFICFLFHVNVFCSFLRYVIFKFQYSNCLTYWYLYVPKFENWSLVSSNKLLQSKLLLFVASIFFFFVIFYCCYVIIDWVIVSCFSAFCCVWGLRFVVVD